MKTLSARTLRRGATATVAALAIVAAAAPAATAHDQRLPDAAHYLTKIDSFAPSTQGVTASVSRDGSWVEVSNSTPNVLTVLGYSREPFLQISKTSVSENSVSPSKFLNESLFGDVTPSAAAADDVPVWTPVSTTNTYRWHDHRLHWMGVDRPPGVQAHPEAGQLIGHWTIHMLLDAQPIDLTGSLNWLPVKENLFPVTVGIGVNAAFAVLAAGFVGAILRRRRRSERGEAESLVAA
jgi:hypothetical protein